MSQVNRNYSYIFDVDGYTVWERLRIIRNFMSDREKALALANLHTEKHDMKQERRRAKLEELRKRSLENENQNVINVDLEEEIIDLEFEIREADIEFKDHADLTQDCVDELNFIREFEAKLAIEAEKTRIEGKSDREMYEINYPEEARTRKYTEAINEMVAHGRLSTSTLHNVRKDPVIGTRLLEEGIITNEGLSLLLDKRSGDLAALTKLLPALPASMLEDLSDEVSDTLKDMSEEQ